jgi:hypothetical protein
MSRSGRFKAGLAIMKRMGELKLQHDWSNDQYASSLALADEQLPLALHFIGMTLHTSPIEDRPTILYLYQPLCQS